MLRYFSTKKKRPEYEDPWDLFDGVRPEIVASASTPTSLHMVSVLLPVRDLLMSKETNVKRDLLMLKEKY